MGERKWRHVMKRNVGKVVEQEVWLVVVYKDLEFGKLEILQKAFFEDEESSEKFVNMVNQLKDEDVQIAISKDTIKLIEAE